MRDKADHCQERCLMSIDAPRDLAIQTFRLHCSMAMATNKVARQAHGLRSELQLELTAAIRACCIAESN